MTLWTKKEIDFLKANKEKSRKDLAIELGRSKHSIEQQMCRLGFKKIPPQQLYAWNDKNDKILLDNYQKLSYRELSDILKRSEHAVRNRLKILGATKKTHCSGWTEQEDEKLKKLFAAHTPIKEICNIINRSGASIRQRAKKVLKIDTPFRIRKVEIKTENFYYNLKRVLSDKTAVAECCICGYTKYIDLHHIDGNRKNNHISNIASLCPNHHREVSGGEHSNSFLFCSWWRVYPDGITSNVFDNRKERKDGRQIFIERGV
jgi:hypothetical protein